MFKNTVVKSDKFKTGQDNYVEKKILDVKKQDILIGSIPVMVKSILCKTSEKGKENCKKGDCAFDQGGYFVIKGAEKVSLTNTYIYAYCHSIRTITLFSMPKRILFVSNP